MFLRNYCNCSRPWEGLLARTGSVVTPPVLPLVVRYLWSVYTGGDLSERERAKTDHVQRSTELVLLSEPCPVPKNVSSACPSSNTPHDVSAASCASAASSSAAKASNVGAAPCDSTKYDEDKGQQQRSTENSSSGGNGTKGSKTLKH